MNHDTSWGARWRAPILLAAVFLVLVAVPGRPAAQTPLTPERQEAIEKLLEVTGTLAQARATAERTSGDALDLMMKSRPGVSPRMIEVAKEVMSAEAARLVESPDGVMPAIVASYAKHYTHEDILGLLAFYNTELGRKVAKTTPILVQEIVIASHKVFQRNMPRIQQVMQARLKAEGLLP